MSEITNKPTVANKPKLHVVSCSGGKDSTALILMMMDKGMPIDVVLNCDTGMEFPEMYEHLDKLEAEIKERIGIGITRLRADHSFEYYFLEAPVKRRRDTEFSAKFGKNHTGYGWAGPKMRWCTTRLKTDIINRYLTELRKKYDVVQYVGIAADEPKRIRDLNYPLVEWGVTEADALQYCYDHGYDFGGLYKLFHRVSCWCCPLQGLSELRNLRKHFPELWAKLLYWETRTWRSFRADYSVDELEIRFAFEEECEAAGKSIRNRAFYKELKQRIMRAAMENEKQELAEAQDARTAGAPGKAGGGNG